MTCNPDVRHPGSLWNVEQVFDERCKWISGFDECFSKSHALCKMFGVRRLWSVCFTAHANESQF